MSTERWSGTTLVIDANAAIACADRGEFYRFAGAEIAAPHILWSEVRSVLHRSIARKLVSSKTAETIMERFLEAPITACDVSRSQDPWNIAEVLGWAKTYDAEYLSVARDRGATIVSLDRQVRIGAQRLGIQVAAI
jgi:predicted nucleic acid-binding protein